MNRLKLLRKELAIVSELACNEYLEDMSGEDVTRIWERLLGVFEKWAEDKGKPPNLAYDFLPAGNTPWGRSGFDSPVGLLLFLESAGYSPAKSLFEELSKEILLAVILVRFMAVEKDDEIALQAGLELKRTRDLAESIKHADLASKATDALFPVLDNYASFRDESKARTQTLQNARDAKAEKHAEEWSSISNLVDVAAIEIYVELGWETKKKEIADEVRIRAEKEGWSRVPAITTLTNTSGEYLSGRKKALQKIPFNV